MKCFIDGRPCLQKPKGKEPFSLKENLSYCRYCSNTSSINTEFAEMLRTLETGNIEFKDSILSQKIQREVVDIADDVLSQGVLLKKFIIKEAESFSDKLSNCSTDFQKIRKLFDGNWWWLEHIMPESVNIINRDNISCDSLVELFHEVNDIISWGSGDFFTSGIEVTAGLFEKIKEFEE